MLLIPYGTDAPIYHLPIATGVTIGINVIVFVIQVVFHNEAADWTVTDALSVQFGQINPLTWITAVYAHGGIGHILGNMLFLFIFGIVVEGKIGWWRFLLLYNFMGFVASGMIALMMLWASAGAALGASCAIFGLMAVAMVWAPENEIYMKFVYIFFFRPIMINIEVSVLMLSFTFLALNFLIAGVSGFSMSSETAHLIGFVPGLAIGMLMLSMRQVDCDGYDLISIMRGKRGQRVKTAKQEKDDATQAASEAEEAQAEFENAWGMIDRYINSGHFDVAAKRFEMLKRKRPGLIMPEPWLVKLIRGSAPEGEHNEKSVRLMQHYLEHYHLLNVPITLNLARYYIMTNEQPRKGLKQLATIRSAGLNPQQTATYNSLAKYAKRLVADGVIEVEE